MPQQQGAKSQLEDLETSRAEVDRLCMAEAMHIAEKVQLSEVQLAGARNNGRLTRWFVGEFNMGMWFWFLSHGGYPGYRHPFIDGMFQYKLSSYWGTPIYGNHHMILDNINVLEWVKTLAGFKGMNIQRQLF